MLIPTKYKKSISFLPSFFCVFICSFTCSHVQFECSAVVFWAPPTSSTIGGCRTRGVTRGPWFACLLLWLVSLNVGVNREENDISKQTELNELNIQLIQLLYIRKFYTKYQPGVNSFFLKNYSYFCVVKYDLIINSSSSDSISSSIYIWFKIAHRCENGSLPRQTGNLVYPASCSIAAGIGSSLQIGFSFFPDDWAPWRRREI